MGMWYRRDEAQRRFTFFFSSTTLAGAFGGLLASGLGKMQGLRGYNGWRWIFIIEGVITCVVSFFWFFAIPDFPEEAKWLTEEERAFVKEKLARDVGKSEHEKSLTVKDVLDVFKDCEYLSICVVARAELLPDKIFVGGLMYFGLIVPAYGMVLKPLVFSTGS